MDKNSNYSLLRVSGSFFKLIGKSINAWRTMLLYGAVSTLIYYVLQICQMSCGNGNEQCYMYVQYIATVCLAILFLGYTYDNYKNAFKNGVFKYADLIKFDANKIKSCLFSAFYVLLYIVPVFVAKIIIFKQANPDWRIEFIYFTILFIFCLLPIAAMRFSMVVAFYYNEQKIPSFKYLYEKTKGKSYVGIIGFLLITLIMAVLNLHIYGYEIRMINEYPSSVFVQVLSTFLDIIAKLFTLNVIFCFFEAQRQAGQTEELLIKDEETVADKPKNKKTNAKKKNKSK